MSAHRNFLDRQLGRVPQGTNWVFHHRSRSGREFYAFAKIDHGTLRIEYVLRGDEGSLVLDRSTAGMRFDTPTSACQAIDPSGSYNGYREWKFMCHWHTTLDDVERGRVLISSDGESVIKVD